MTPNGLTRDLKIVVERYSDGYVAYPLGLQGVVVGEGDTYDEALQDVISAIRFHVETFGDEVSKYDSPVLGAFLTRFLIPTNRAGCTILLVSRSATRFMSVFEMILGRCCKNLSGGEFA